MPQLTVYHRDLELQYPAPLHGQYLFDCIEWTPDSSDASILRACIPTDRFNELRYQCGRKAKKPIAAKMAKRSGADKL